MKKVILPVALVFAIALAGFLNLSMSLEYKTAKSLLKIQISPLDGDK